MTFPISHAAIIIEVSWHTVGRPSDDCAASPVPTGLDGLLLGMEPHGTGLSPLPARQIAAAVLPSRASKPREERMAADSVYKVIELIGTSSESWEKAARTAVERAAESLRDLRIAEVTAQDVQLKDGKVELFRTKLKVSFKYEKGGD
jgi:dodecin